jgi:flagellin
MSAVINTNIASLNAQRNLNGSQGALENALQRLSSGLRINSARDDAAGLAISQRMTSQIRGLDQARRNANDGVSLAQTAEGALSGSGDMLQRIRELAIQSANATNSVSDRAALQAEAGQLASELDRVATTTQFNGLNLLDGTAGPSVFQVGANANQTITASGVNFRTSNYGNNRIGGVVAATSNAVGDLTTGSTANAVVSAGAAVSRVVGTTFTVNGAAGSSLITYAAGASAQTVAGLVNAKTGTTGVSATARTEVDLTALALSSSFSLAVTSDNSVATTVSFSTGAALNADGLAAGIKAFNDVSSNTGVTAKLNTAGTGITLTNANGNNITILGNAASAAATFGTSVVAGSTAVATGQLTLDSDKTFGVTGATVTDWFNSAASASQLQKVNQIDISTVAGATRAIAQVDAALANVNSTRGDYGALQNRFGNAIISLQTTSENLSAARSRILDTDFAAETANLTRAQILQQAGTAMLAQANQVPNQVLTLLR